MDRPCQHCGQPAFYKSRVPKYCSWQCYIAHPRPHKIIEQHCQHCGQVFTNRKAMKFCSRRCFYSWQRANLKPLPRSPRYCVHCDQVIANPRSQKYCCQSCYHSWRRAHPRSSSKTSAQTLEYRREWMQRKRWPWLRLDLDLLPKPEPLVLLEAAAEAGSYGDAKHAERHWIRVRELERSL